MLLVKNNAKNELNKKEKETEQWEEGMAEQRVEKGGGPRLNVPG